MLIRLLAAGTTHVVVPEQLVEHRHHPGERLTTSPTRAADLEAFRQTREVVSFQTIPTLEQRQGILTVPVRRAPSSATSARAMSAFENSTFTTCSTVTWSWSGCQQSKSVTIATVA